MPNATINNRATVDGITYTTAKTIPADGVVRKEKTALAAAKTGQLTTRSSATAGTLTMASGHGITTAARLDIFWTEGGVNGHRRGVTVGTVSGLSVPISGGAGDNLPSNLVNVTVCVPAEEEFLLTGNNAQYITAKTSRRGVIVFADASNVEKLAIYAEFDAATGGGYQWFTGNGVTNPVSGATVTKVFFSNADSAYTNAIVANVGIN